MTGGVIRGRLGLLFPLILRTGNLRSEKVPAGIRFDHDLVPHGVARVVMSAPPHRKATQYAAISRSKPGGRVLGGGATTRYCFPANRRTDRTPMIVTKEGTPLAWIRGTCSEQRAAGTVTHRAGMSVVSLPLTRANAVV